MKYQKKWLILVLSILISLIAVGFGNAALCNTAAGGACNGYSDAKCDFVTKADGFDKYGWIVAGTTSDCGSITDNSIARKNCFCKEDSLYSEMQNQKSKQLCNTGQNGRCYGYQSSKCESIYISNIFGYIDAGTTSDCIGRSSTYALITKKCYCENKPSVTSPGTSEPYVPYSLVVNPGKTGEIACDKLSNEHGLPNDEEDRCWNVFCPIGNTGKFGSCSDALSPKAWCDTYPEAKGYNSLKVDCTCNNPKNVCESGIEWNQKKNCAWDRVGECERGPGCEGPDRIWCSKENCQATPFTDAGERMVCCPIGACTTVSRGEEIDIMHSCPDPLNLNTCNCVEWGKAVLSPTGTSAGCCSEINDPCWVEPDKCMANESNLDNYGIDGKYYKCIKGEWIEKCATDAGCQDANLFAGYSYEVLNKYCPDEKKCWECIDGTTWNGNDCVPDKIDWEGNRGVCTGNKCFCKTGENEEGGVAIEGCDRNNFGDVINSEERQGALSLGPEGLCVPSGKYTEDHYCESGEWTTRTGLIAAELLSYVENKNDFVLYCDSHAKTLNKIPIGFDSGKFNNFCVLRNNDNKEIAFGSSLNDISVGDIDTGNTQIFQVVDCTNINEGTETFERCSAPTTNYLFWNPNTKSFIYGIDINSGTLTKIWNSIKLFFQHPIRIIELLINPITKEEFESKYNQVYINRNYDKEINAIYFKNDPEQFEVVYTNFETDICSALPLGEISCEYKEADNSYYVYSYETDLWPDLTTKLRVK